MLYQNKIFTELILKNAEIVGALFMHVGLKFWGTHLQTVQESTHEIE